MLYDLKDESLQCGCGSKDFEIVKSFQVKPLEDSRCEASYQLHSGKILIRCSRCGKVLDESSVGKLIGLDYSGA